MTCENVKISVIIPVYNAAQYLIRCLDSVRMNSYTNLEIICVNDGSTDGSLDILKDYEKKDKRIIVIDKKNGGASSARNAGLIVATGEIIAFIDSDDWIHKNYFEAMLYAMTTKQLDIVVCSHLRIRDDNHKLEKDLEISKINVKKLSDDEFFAHQNAKGYVWGKLYKKKIIQNIVFYEDIYFAEDVTFNFQVLFQNPDICIEFMDVQLYYYYYRADSSVNTYKFEESYYAIEKLYDMLMKSDCSNPYYERYLIEIVKRLLALRYHFYFDKEYRKYKKQCNVFMDKCLKKLKGNCSWKIILSLFRLFPKLYRRYSIWRDPTLIEWEQKQKQ